MTQDLFQNYPTFGAYTGLNNPFSSPYNTMQLSAMNPAAAFNPLAAQQAGAQGIYGGGINPQQLQLAATLAAQSAFANGGQQNPYAGVFQNQAALQNQIASAILQNLLAAAVNQNPWQQQQQQNLLQNPVLAQLAGLGQQTYTPFQNPFQAHHHQQIGQGIPGFGQQLSPFGQLNSPLAPQSWVGQGQYGQVNPILAQLAARAFQGGSPWGGGI